MLCEMCQEREATVHATHIAGEDLKHRNLCDKCFEAAKPTQARDLATALQAGCRHCGGEPYTGSGHSLDGLSGTMKLSFMCKPLDSLPLRKEWTLVSCYGVLGRTSRCCG